jgi:putative Mn2+ efflux pump MntP
MDAFAVAIVSGTLIRKMHIRHALLIAAFFGGFQAVMPLVGWALGRSARAWLDACGAWIAFGMLIFVGIKMIAETFWNEGEKVDRDPLNIYVLFLLALATSIDAFAVGLSLALLKVSILSPIIVIGTTTFVFSFAGTYIGDVCGHFFEKKVEILGGVILIGIGLKILFEHLI